MKYTMSRNEAKSFLREKANEYSLGRLSWDEFKAIEIEYTPLDLSAFPVKTETAEWINNLFDEETEDKHGNYMLRGFTYQSVFEKEKLGCTYGDAGCDCLNYYAFNDAEMLLFTFCEGDTTLTLFTDPQKYQEEKAKTEKWYREER